MNNMKIEMTKSMMTIIKKHWFLLGLFAVFSVTLTDDTEFVSLAGILCKSHNGANAAIFIIFLCRELGLC